MSYENTKPKNDSAVNTFTIMPNATYFFKMGGEITPFVRGGIGYTTSSQNGVSLSGLAYKGAAGIAYFVNEAVALTGSVDYTGRNLKADGASTSVSYTNLGVGIGVALFF